MQFPMMCLDCLKDPQIGRLVYAVVDLDDDGHLAGECEQGHAVRYARPRPNHEWLTTAGAFAFCDGYYRDAFCDGYYREASASFAAGPQSSFAFFAEVSLV